MNHKILLIGSSGMLGSEVFSKLNSMFAVVPTSFNNSVRDSLFLDFTNFNSLLNIVNEYNPSIVINCSAFTDVDKCEKNKLIARSINVNGLKNIIKAVNKNTKIIHISSDYVFDGKKGSYSEDDITHPINYYGKTKLEAENILIGSNKPYVIIRTNVLYGYNFSYNNFLKWVISSLSDNKSISVVSDQISNPTYIPELVNAIFSSIILDYRGLLHIGSKDAISRYEFSKKISKVFKLNSNLIIKTNSSNIQQAAIRPLNSNLEIDKIQDVLDLKLADTEYYINKIYTKNYK